jgi:glycosyltransferase involved in cell wall biosynthesis
MDSLVSVIIATFNSSPFIIETLESVLAQTWKDIELIITDDFSRDETVEICGKWQKKNFQRFNRIEIITSKMNTGIPANVNRGLCLANGSWIKFLGADDTLKPDCIEKNMSWIATHPEVKVLFSRIDIFKDTFIPENLLFTTPGIPYDNNGILSISRSAYSQYKMLLQYDRIHFTPSAFINRGTLLSVGSFEEKFKFLEDYPLWLKFTKNGHKLYFMDIVTVNYRRHSKAINNTGIKLIVNPNYFRNEGFRKEYTYPYLPYDIELNQRYIWYISQLFRCNCFNKANIPNKILHALLTTYLNPFKYFIWVRKKIDRNLKNNELYI